MKRKKLLGVIVNLLMRQKKAVLASENSFESWIKTAIAGVWKKILEVGSSEIITGIYHYLKKQLFGS